MAGIVIVAHPDLASQLARAAQHVLGASQPALRAVDIPPDRPYEQALEEVRAAVAHMTEEAGSVVIVTDMYGGTPTNLALCCRMPGQTEVVSGASLPMLVRLLTYQRRPLDELVEKAVEGGREGIVVGSPFPLSGGGRS